MSVASRLSEVFESSEKIPFDDSSKFILFSDCHRGDNSWTDDFAQNQNIFFHALNFYYDGGFTYIEVGDGDELCGALDQAQDECLQDAHGGIGASLGACARGGR